jgi:hypothetical protein
VKGLRPKLRRALIGMDPPTYSVVVEIASQIERGDLELTKQRTKGGF